MKTAAARNQDRSERIRLIDHVANFIQKHRMIFLGLFIVALLAVVAALLYAEVSQARQEVGALRAEALVELFSRWQAADEQERSDLEAEIAAGVEEIRRSYRGTFAEQRALSIAAALAFEKAEWGEAARLWTTLADAYPASHLAPIALANAAAAHEEQGEADKAVQTLERIVNTYGETFADLPRVLFSLGRLSEAASEYERAAGYYEQLIDTHIESGWSNLARNRIIHLRSVGSLE